MVAPIFYGVLLKNELVYVGCRLVAWWQNITRGEDYGADVD